MEYKVGDIYRERVKMFNGFNIKGEPEILNSFIDWEIVKVFDDAILCKNKSNRNDKYKLIQMEVC